MKIKKGDKIRLIKKMSLFTNVGDVCEVIDVNDRFIAFKFEDGGFGQITINEVDEYFEAYNEDEECCESNDGYEYEQTVLADCETLLDFARVETQVFFDKCTVMAVQLNNGYVIAESSICLNPKEYDREHEEKICMEKIVNKLKELETYEFQTTMYDCGAAYLSEDGRMIRFGFNDEDADCDMCYGCCDCCEENSCS